MADFTGLTVRMTLKDGFVVEGKVQRILPENQTLMLQNVYSPLNGWRSDSFSVQGQFIADLNVINTSAAPTPTSGVQPNAPAFPQAQQQQQQPSMPAPTVPAAAPPQPAKPQRQASQFVDPAILSYGRSPVQTRPASMQPEPTPTTPVKSMLAKAAETLPTNTSPFIGEAPPSSTPRKPSAAKVGAQKTDTPVRKQTQNIQADGTQDVATGDAKNKKKDRKVLKQKKAPAGSTPATQDPPPVMNVEVSRNGNDMDGNVRRGKGWRSTPFLQPSPQTSSPKEKAGSQKKSRRQQQEEKEGQRNGWLTEDATDIQDLGDFDFEANHKLFDKKQVFDQLRQGDTTADEDRLVSHNKLARPGTYGGKNLHPTENVLSPQLGPKYHSNELDSTSDADTELNLANGRSSSRHSASRVALKKQPSRQNSAQVDPRPHPLSASISSDRPLSRTAHSISGRPGRTVPSVGTSPMPDRTHSPQSAVSTSKAQPTPQLGSQQPESHLAISPRLVTCPVLLPSALDTLEQVTVARFGLTQEAITESAARSIAETAMNLLQTSSSRRGSRANTLQRGMSTSGLGIDRSTTPIIVVLAGNHALGARALAAARHLACRRTKIIIAEAQYESRETQDSQVKAQIASLRRMAKTGRSIERGPWRKASGYIKKLSGPPALIIDALLGGATYHSLSESSNSEHVATSQQETREMIGWANRSRAPVLSVGCPSGVSGADGTTTTYEGEPLAVRPDKLLCLAAPMQGVLDAMKAGERWDTSLADVGVNIALRSDEAVAFGSHWVVDIKFVESEDVGAEQQ